MTISREDLSQDALQKLPTSVLLDMFLDEAVEFKYARAYTLDKLKAELLRRCGTAEGNK